MIANVASMLLLAATMMSILQVSKSLDLSQKSPTRTAQHLVLIGGGHAHAQVIKALNQKSRPSHLKVTLIDAQRSAIYSGMVPGCVSKLYHLEQTMLHLEPLCEWAGIDFINDEVLDVDLENRCICMRNTAEQIVFDAVSLDIGSTSRGIDEIPGASAWTIPTRPISKLVDRIQEAQLELGNEAHVVVVGGGAAGIELSMSILGRWKPILGSDLRVTVLDSGPELVPNESMTCRTALLQILDQKGIDVLHNCHVKEITKDAALLGTGEQIPCTHCLWATGAAAQPLAHRLGTRGLAVNQRGWIQVNQHLQSISHPFVFAAGDCSNIEGLLTGVSPPKAGVYAVRAGPILIENLSAYLQGMPLIKYTPQDDFLKLIVCGDGKALGFRFGHPIYGRWVMQLKDHIDQMFMSLFKEENLPTLNNDKASYDTSQYDADTESDRLPLHPQKAAELLRRTDDDVDYVQAWNVLRDMTKVPDYQRQVLARMNHLPFML